MAESAVLEFAGLLRQLRAQAGLTQEELAEAAGLSPRSVSDLERGVNRTARKDTALLLAGALGLAEPVRAVFVAAARGRTPAMEVLAARRRAAEAPPVTAGGLHGFPAALTSFVGRARELAEVRALLGSSRLVTLTGAGGCGKTRLGLRVAAELPDGSRDGVWLVELAAVTDEDAVAPAISRALGITGQPGRPALEALLDTLAPQDILIVLDNCEHLIGGCAMTADAILRRCPRVHLLATSREPLGIGGETIYRVPSLSLPGLGEAGTAAAGSCDAVALFADRARAQGAGLRVDEQTIPLVVSICRQLDGMPLAIELAAARLRSLSLTDLHDRLGQRFRLLTGGSRTALARQQTLRATVEWSYSALNGAEQLLLGRLSVFAESFGLDAAEAVCGFAGIEAFDVVSLLGSLVDKSLVVAEPAGETLRYRLLETIRQFAAEKLAETDPGNAAATEAAHCAHYLSVAETAARHLTGPAQGRWLALLDADQANVRHAAGHAAADPERTAQVLRFGAALRRYWMTRSRYAEPFALLVPVLERPEADADPGLFIAALITAQIAARFVDIAVALPLGEQAVVLARELGDGRLLTESLAALSAAYYHAGQPGRGLLLGEEAVERARQLGNDVLLGRSLSGYLLLASDHVDLARHTQLFTEAIACTERSGDRFINCQLHNNAGSHALNTGDIQAARAHLQRAAQVVQEIGASSYHVPTNLGEVLRLEGDSDGARSMFEAALRISRRNGELPGLAYASLGLACLAADLGDWHRAGELHGAVQALLDRTGQRWERGEARRRQDSLDQVHAHLGQEQFDRVYAHGTTLSLEQALDVALAEQRLAVPSAEELGVTISTIGRVGAAINRASHSGPPSYGPTCE